MKKFLTLSLLLCLCSNVFADFNTGDTFGKGIVIQANGVNQTGGGRTLNFASGTTVTVNNNAYQITASGGLSSVTTDSTLTGDGTGGSPLGIALTHSNTWTGQQIFNTTAPQVGTATANTITLFDASKNLVSASTATYPSLIELSYVKGVTSAIQTQLNSLSSLWTLSSLNQYSPITNTVTVGTSSTSLDTFTVQSTGVNGLSVNATAAGVIDANTLLLAHGNGSLVDSSSNAYANTNNGATTANSVTPFASGGSINFNGTTQWTSWAATAPSAKNPFTYECFIYFTTLPTSGNDSYFMSSLTSAGGGILYGVHNSSGTYTLVTAQYNGGSNTFNHSYTIPTPTTGTWYGLSFSSDGTNERTFWGPAGGTASLIGTDTTGTIGAQSNGLYLGAFYRDSGVVGGLYFAGNIAEVRYSNVSRYTVSYPLQTVRFPVPAGSPANTLLVNGVQTAKIWTDGNNFNRLALTGGTTDGLYISSIGIPSFPTLTSNGPIYTSGGIGTLNVGTTTGSGTVYALATSPTIATPTVTTSLTISSGNIITDTSTGTSFGTGTTQKTSAYGVTPVVQAGATTDLGTVLSNWGLRASGTAYPITTSGVATFTGGVTINTGNLTLTDKDVVLGTTTGTKIGTSTSQKIGFFNATPVVQQTGNVCTSMQNLGLVTSCTESGAFARLFSHFADVGNTNTSETDLYTDTISAGKLASNGDTITAQYGGTFVGAATATQELKAYFGGTVIMDSGPLTISSGTKYWRMDVSCVRESATNVRCSVNLITNSNLLNSTTLYTLITGLTLGNTQIIKITGQAAGAGGISNEVVASEGYINYQPI